jgi:hypothetical protein
MDRTVDTAAAHQTRIRRVDYRVNVLGCEIANFNDYSTI